MTESKYEAIRKWISGEFPGAQIEEGNVSFNRGYKIRVENEMYIFKIGGEYLMDNDEGTIVDDLQKWHIAEELRNNSDVGVLVTRLGPETFELE